MKLVKTPELSTLREEDGWKLLEEKTINDRTLLAWYNPREDMISLMIFHVSDQPNEFSKRSPHTNWGFATFWASEMKTPKEAAEVVSLYLKDMENERYWWEIIN